ncbi:MAG: nucleotidyltransferase family protein, partial [Acidaminococcaceae bacterium]
EYRAVAMLDGRPLVSYIIDALLACDAIEKITISGTQKELAGIDLPANVQLVEAGGTMLDNTLAAIRSTGAVKPVLFVTDDVPLLTKKAVNDFLQKVKDQNADVFYPIIPKSACLRDFPEGKRTYVTFRDGSFTGGNILLVNPRIVASCKEVAEQVFAKRKYPWKLCSWLGWSFVLRFLLHRLKVQDVEARASQLLGVRGKAVITEFAEIGMDVDKEEDWHLIEASMRTQAGCHK